MNKNLHLRVLTPQAVAAKAFTLAALLVLWALPGQAAQNSAQFVVSINLKTGGPYRFVTHDSSAGESLGTVDSYAGTGTITSWRMVKLADLDYLEMMVHW